MKKINYILLLFVALFTTSCLFTEEITINKDGSGTYNLDIDMGGMIKGLGGMTKDSLKEPEKVDSIIYFKDIIEQKKDSIKKLSKEEQETINAIKDLKMHLVVDEAKGDMKMAFILDFKDISAIDDIQKKIEGAQKMQENKETGKESISNHEIKYEYSKKRFARKVIMKELTPEEQEEYDNNQTQYGMFIAGSLFKLKYNFPKKIKSVSYPDVKYSDNHKSLYIEIPMDSVMKNPKLLDFEVRF